jgi:hypothetical protein
MASAPKESTAATGSPPKSSMSMPPSGAMVAIAASIAVRDGGRGGSRDGHQSDEWNPVAHGGGHAAAAPARLCHRAVTGLKKAGNEAARIAEQRRPALMSSSVMGGPLEVGRIVRKGCVHAPRLSKPS